MTTEQQAVPQDASLETLLEQVVGAAYEVSNVLGSGFLEKVYERALIEELSLRGIPAGPQAQIPVKYKGRAVGDDLADILVDGHLIVELKCADRISREHVAQCLNYLRASGRCLALLINFQHPRVEWRRIVAHPVHPVYNG